MAGRYQFTAVEITQSGNAVHSTVAEHSQKMTMLQLKKMLSHKTNYNYTNDTKLNNHLPLS